MISTFQPAPAGAVLSSGGLLPSKVTKEKALFEDMGSPANEGDWGASRCPFPPLEGESFRPQLPAQLRPICHSPPNPMLSHTALIICRAADKTN